MDSSNFPPITGQRVSQALIDEVFKPPISHHGPPYKRLRKGRRGRTATEPGFAPKQKTDRESAICSLAECPITTFDGHFAHKCFT